MNDSPHAHDTDPAGAPLCGAGPSSAGEPPRLAASPEDVTCPRCIGRAAGRDIGSGIAAGLRRLAAGLRAVTDAASPEAAALDLLTTLDEEGPDGDRSRLYAAAARLRDAIGVADQMRFGLSVPSSPGLRVVRPRAEESAPAASTVCVYEDPAARHLVEEWRASMGPRIASWEGVNLGGTGYERAVMASGEVLLLVRAEDGGIEERAAWNAAQEAIRAGGGFVRKLICFGRVPVLCPHWRWLESLAAEAARETAGG